VKKIFLNSHHQGQNRPGIIAKKTSGNRIMRKIFLENRYKGQNRSVAVVKNG
tara:strand:+ start:666 stop:821 length:156 start_codon:yes stop_codon:yes gene_type:complete